MPIVRRAASSAAMLLACSLLLALPAATQTASAQTGELSTRARVWELGGKLSFAALGKANGAPREAVEHVFASAQQLASQLGVDVPPLPDLPLNRSDANAVVLNYLLNDAGSPIAATLGRTYGADHAALFEVSVKSSLLLLLYSPGEQIGQQIAEVIRKRAPDAKLPEQLWHDVTARIDAQATYDQVKDAVATMQSDVRRYLKSK